MQCEHLTTGPWEIKQQNAGPQMCRSTASRVAFYKGAAHYTRMACIRSLSSIMLRIMLWRGILNALATTLPVRFTETNSSTVQVSSGTIVNYLVAGIGQSNKMQDHRCVMAQLQGCTPVLVPFYTARACLHINPAHGESPARILCPFFQLVQLRFSSREADGSCKF